MSEKSELFQEITNVYGVVNINPETGEITEISN